MRKIDRKHFAVAGMITGALTAGLMLLGVGVVLGNPLEPRILLAFIGYGTVVGLVTAALVFFRLKIAGSVFVVGLLFGFFEMFRAFFSNMNGWGDLAGILSVMLWPAVGLISGLILQAGYHFYTKLRTGKKHD